MKFTKISLLILVVVNIVFLINPSMSINLSSSVNKTPKAAPEVPANPSDAVYKRIRDYISSVAEEKMKSSDLMTKKKLAGSLPQGYPEETIKKALETRNDKKIWNPILGLPTKLHKICIYPSAKVNYVKWCNNSFFGSKDKGETCLYNFCQVCCDHLVFIYQNSAEKNIIGNLLQLNQEQGIKAIKDIVDKTTIIQCKSECRKQYPVDMPETQMKTPRDPELGTEKKPGLSCSDIQKWGAKTAKSGVYWIELASKGPQKVFCDMETNKGGWTLFFNYLHQPGFDMLLNANKLPNDLKTNSHMYLQGAGFTSRDVKEIRFLCTEKFKAEKKFWHFKSSNRDIISVAMKGDQTSLKPNSLASGYTEVKPPAAILGKYTQAVNRNQIGQFNIAGMSSKGGFTSTTFGSTNYDANWTVKGDSENQDVFECGSSHRANDNTTPEDSPNMVFTHHSVWFRGNAPSADEARERYMNNISK